MEGRDSRKKKLLLLLLGLLLVAGVAVLIQFLLSDSDSEWDDDQSQSTIGEITYEGHRYSYNQSLTNILFLGIDNNDVIREGDLPGDAGQSDCILLLTLNRETKQGQILQIPRDTMTEVDLYDASGEYYTTVIEQITTQYAYATGGQNSCRAVKKTVSELLYDLPIDGYLAMDMAAVSIVNDAIGGVTVTFPEDYTRIDPAFEKGATLKLAGKQAYDFVHYRDTNQDFSNNGRMQRQMLYVPAMIDTIQGNAKLQENYYKVLYPLVEKYMVTDLEEDEMNKLMEYQLDMDKTQILPGEGEKGEKYEEFYVDEEKLKKILIETFYILEK